MPSSRSLPPNFKAASEGTTLKPLLHPSLGIRRTFVAVPMGQVGTPVDFFSVEPSQHRGSSVMSPPSNNPAWGGGDPPKFANCGDRGGGPYIAKAVCAPDSWLYAHIARAKPPMSPPITLNPIHLWRSPKSRCNLAGFQQSQFRSLSKPCKLVSLPLGFRA